MQGATVKLFCKANGSPEPNIIWNKDGAPLSPGPRVSMSEDRTEVTINMVQRSDGGIYSCTFINSVGQVMQRIDLIVEGTSGAYVLNPPVNMTAVEGQLVTFHCEADANPNNITYRWYFENRQIDMTIPSFRSRFSVNQQGSLSINNVQKRDMGWYICRPSNGVGQDPEAAAYLNVTYPPKVIKDLIHKRLIWALGFQEQLDCPVDANPPVTEIIWSKDNYLVEFSSNRRTQLSNGTLLVKRVEQIDAGQYSCIPLSTAGRGDTSPIVQIVVRDPPRFVLRPEEHYIRKPGEGVTMICSAAGTPEPVVTWRRVLTTPHAPYNLTAIPSWFSVQIRWLPAYNGGSPQHYVLW
ncbi:hypothetical protein KUTeg_006265 [Tegillarca granosa]|uniref:Ig-like domain-containing protein n=1 Tax=Tegillarca granosa TaxID=220873 RepID=A0ABQ9FG03_TEGGR|nr:hypothetical protein KUTeg_006265 [Tegillarca granosa]